MRRALLALAAAAAVAGCTTVPQTRTVTVNVPVPIPCSVETPARPALPLAALVAPYTLDQWVAAAIAQDRIWGAYVEELVAALEACTAPAMAGNEKAGPEGPAPMMRAGITSSAAPSPGP